MNIIKTFKEFLEYRKAIKLADPDKDCDRLNKLVQHAYLILDNTKIKKKITKAELVEAISSALSYLDEYLNA